MSTAAHAAAIIGSLAAIGGSAWLIYVHFIAYADRIIDALLMEDRRPGTGKILPMKQPRRSWFCFGRRA